MSKNSPAFSPRGIFSDDFINAFTNTPIIAKFTSNKMEMFEKDGNLIVNFEVPGFSKDNFDINFEEGVLTVSAEKTHEAEEVDESKKYYYKETSQDAFLRAVNLPVDVVSEEASAKYIDGMLRITIPKTDKSKSKKINIKPD